MVATLGLRGKARDHKQLVFPCQAGADFKPGQIIPALTTVYSQSCIQVRWLLTGFTSSKDLDAGPSWHPPAWASLHQKATDVHEERELMHMHIHVSRGRGREKGGERILSQFCTISTEADVGLKLMNCEIMTWAKIKSQMFNQLSHPGASGMCFKIF